MMRKERRVRLLLDQTRLEGEVWKDSPRPWSERAEPTCFMGEMPGLSGRRGDTLSPLGRPSRCLMGELNSRMFIIRCALPTARACRSSISWLRSRWLLRMASFSASVMKRFGERESTAPRRELELSRSGDELGPRPRPPEVIALSSAVNRGRSGSGVFAAARSFTSE